MKKSGNTTVIISGRDAMNLDGKNTGNAFRRISSTIYLHNYKPTERLIKHILNDVTPLNPNERINFTRVTKHGLNVRMLLVIN